jgi:hypothetical protein
MQKSTAQHTTLCVVSQIQPDRFVELRLLNLEGWQPVGRVPIPAHQPIPKIGDVVAVGHSPTRSGQPVPAIYLDVCPEIEPYECIVQQQQLKPPLKARAGPYALKELLCQT